jgi:acyl carrier protein
MHEWERRKYLVKGRIDGLKAGGKGVHHIQRGLAHKLFAALVQYDDKYRGMEEVILSSEALEATSQVAFQSTSKGGNFFMSPCFIDSVAHIPGFIMNANDAVDSKKYIYISHGLESMRFARNPDAEKRYTSYVKMQPVPGAKGMVTGDVYMLEGEDIIGVVGGLKFQMVPRVLLDTLFRMKSKPSARPASAKTTEQKVPQAISKTQKSPTKISTRKLQIKEKATTNTTASTKVVTSQALQIIASEVGCEMSELADPIQLSDLGIDSLISLSISGRFREELELKFSSSFFSDISTIGSLKAYLQQFESSNSPNISGMSTPYMASGDSGFSEDSEILVEVVEDVEGLGVSSDKDDLVHIIRSMIAEEMGVELEEISDNTDLSTMGMDSLMSLSILGAPR